MSFVHTCAVSKKGRKKEKAWDEDRLSLSRPGVTLGVSGGGVSSLCMTKVRFNSSNFSPLTDSHRLFADSHRDDSRQWAFTCLSLFVLYVGLFVSLSLFFLFFKSSSPLKFFRGACKGFCFIGWN